MQSRLLTKTIYRVPISSYADDQRQKSPIKPSVNKQKQTKATKRPLYQLGREQKKAFYCRPPPRCLDHALLNASVDDFFCFLTSINVTQQSVSSRRLCFVTDEHGDFLPILSGVQFGHQTFCH
ncbi:hypothetical protein GWI33_019801 [Rhynchophorus ferrugineus]|uniref:Uncharacterized protein n=1 Tax=Rhynchophorus ferrugineus TaxID=354439 RepID=A0A834HQR3_RHYFE|nr:hypothetical protein GWI33_019801 [Rhynchophorus ferrugineus]